MVKNSSKSSSFYKSLRFYVQLYQKLFLLMLLFTLIGSLITAMLPKLINDLLSSPKIDGQFSSSNLNIYVSLIVALILILGLTFFLRTIFANRLARKIEINYRNRVLDHLLQMDLTFYEKNQSGEIITKIINDTSVVAENAKEIPMLFLSSIATLIGATVVMALIEWKLTLVVLTLTMIILIGSAICFGVLTKWYRRLRKTYTKINGKVLDKLNVIRLIKANATEKYESKRFNDLHHEYDDLGQKIDLREGAILGIFLAAISTINVLAILAGIVFISFGLIEASQTQAVLIPFILSVNTLIFPIFRIINVSARLATVTVSVQRLDDLLNTKSSIFDQPNAVKIDAIQGDVVFKNVSFWYKPNNPVLENFNFQFEKNKSYAIVGTTGVGKSTISKLLLRFYDPQTGQILINDQDLKTLNLQSYLNHVGYIEQEPEIFNGSFFENIKYGAFDSSKEAVIDAAHRAELDSFIESLPDGYETIVGEKGFILSGGQKQRILIARTILKNPQLLILDEATSALDNIVEQEVQKQLLKLMVGRTTIIIAHRLSTIKNVDQILVLEKNKGISQIGTFKELVQIEGQFKKLYEAGMIDV